MRNLTRLILAHARYGKDSNPRPCGPGCDCGHHSVGGIHVDSVGDAIKVEFVLSETLLELWPSLPNVQSRTLMGEAWRLFPERTS